MLKLSPTVNKDSTHTDGQDFALVPESPWRAGIAISCDVHLLEVELFGWHGSTIKFTPYGSQRSIQHEH
jgi:hypothetical protein